MHCRQQERNAGMTLGQSPKLLTPHPSFTGDLGWAESLAWSAVQAWGRGQRLALGPQDGLQDPAAHHTQSVGVDPEALFQVVLSSTPAVRGGRVEDADPILLL